ncbi:GerAB/ArcD/ProY family transporter [Clostridium algidicarnis]|uniref:GerAB/ArcD/ProY family transporter n=1 Tax=Clostridium algidicarnis TaxID=37659 RepID=UPI001C0DDE03|nr:endospore germination permease [Clostridium algidicarnis]MBU3204096.1 endospore germination permease [Clostridium algidicarnis]MBU3212250.1 endospore germination permease [Clostridium algidicarnis]MBU3221245.1 endospore germination permease [Clostridium algidicarnis]
MKGESISNRQMQLLIFYYSIGAYLLFNMGSNLKQDSWIAAIIAVIISVPLMLMYGRVMYLYQGSNLFDIIEIVFGKGFGKFINMIFIIHIFLLGSYLLRDFIDFIKLIALFNTPSVIPSICIGILIIWILKEGIEVMSAWSQFFIRIILAFVFLVWILLIPEMDITKLQPVFNSGFKAISKESFKLLIFPFSDMFIFMTFFDYVDYNKKSKNVFVKPIIMGGSIIVVFTLINIMVLGGEGYNSFYYVGYETIKRLRLQGEFQRAEVAVSIAFTMIQFLEISFCMLGASKGLTKVFNLKDYRYILIPVVILMINFVQIMFKSIMEAMEFTNSLWYSYALLIQIIFPLVIFIAALLKKKYSTNNKKV